MHLEQIVHKIIPAVFMIVLATPSSAQEPLIVDCNDVANSANEACDCEIEENKDEDFCLGLPLGDEITNFAPLVGLAAGAGLLAAAAGGGGGGGSTPTTTTTGGH